MPPGEKSGGVLSRVTPTGAVTVTVPYEKWNVELLSRLQIREK